jgi:hypothetical protein
MHSVFFACALAVAGASFVPRLTIATDKLTWILGAAAQTALFVPGFDPQPISADIIGVGTDGRTTYLLHPGTATGTEDVPAPYTGKRHIHHCIGDRFL